MKVGLGGILVAGVLSLIFGRDFVSPMLNSSEPSRSPAEVQERNRAEQPQVEFVSFVLDDAQQTWHRLLGPRYQDAKLVLFRDGVRSGCGAANAQTGPFYCPADQKVYIDLSFFEELDQRFGAPGDFAQAYVLAHEIGHHVQTLLGVSAKVRQAQERSPSQANELQVRMELQADCLAGVWGHSTQKRGILESGDVQEGLAAAAAVGDDRIQRQARGYVNPESFTHGSSEQRMQWFRRGFSSGDVGSCDTFSGR
jgi:predicted metalloprotease